MKYIKPYNVKSPEKYIDDVEVLYPGKEDSFSIAKINWEGELSLAIRWNVSRGEWDDQDKCEGKKMCIGMPSSRGYPVWFILPKEFLDKKSEVWKIINNSFKENNIK